MAGCCICWVVGGNGGNWGEVSAFVSSSALAERHGARTGQLDRETDHAVGFSDSKTCCPGDGSFRLWLWGAEAFGRVRRSVVAVW